MIEARIINFKRGKMVNEKTGEIKTLLYVNYELKMENDDNFFGSTIMNSTASENAFEILKNNLGKWIKVDISERPVYGKTNQFKKVVSKINGVDIRQF